MNKNQIATLNLTQSLQDFETTVKPLLELGEVEQWDGRAFRDRERKIREAALILAGQCIVLLLFQLSQWQKAQERAIKLPSGLVAQKNGKKRLKKLGNSHGRQRERDAKFTLRCRTFSESEKKKETAKPRILSRFKMVGDGKRSHAFGLVNYC